MGGELEKKLNCEEEKRLVSSLKKIFGTVYFVQGTSSFSALSMFYYMKEVLLLGPVGGQIFQGLNHLAWFIKPLWGYISDKISLFGYHRKSWFVLMAVIALISWASLGLFAYLEVHSVVLFLTLLNFAMSGYAFIDVVTDALMCIFGQKLKKIGSFVTFQWKMLAVSSAIVALSSGWLQEQVHLYRQTGEGFIDYWLIFASTGIFPLLTLRIGIKYIREERNALQESFSFKKIPLYLYQAFKTIIRGAIFAVSILFKLFRKLPVIFSRKALRSLRKSFLKYGEKFKNFRTEQRLFWILVLFIIFWNIRPSIGYVSQIYLVDRLDFTPVIFGWLRATGAVIWLLSIIAYGWFVRRHKDIDWAKYLFAMIILGFIGLIAGYYFYLRPDHPWSFSVGFPWLKILEWVSPFQKIWGLNLIWSAIEELSQWNRYHWWALITEATLGFAAIPGFLIPLTICGQLTSAKSAGMTYAFLMSVSNIATGGLSSLLGGLFYRILELKPMAWLISLFQKSPFNISLASLNDQMLIILQIFVYISVVFIAVTVPFAIMLKREIKKKNIKIYLYEEKEEEEALRKTKLAVKKKTITLIIGVLAIFLLVVIIAGWSLRQRGLDKKIALAEQELRLAEEGAQILAGLYEEKGEFDKSILLYEEIISRKEKILSSAELESILEHLARLYKIQREHEKLAFLYERLSRFDEAIALHQKVIEKKENQLGPEKLNQLIPRLEYLKNICEDQNKHDLAKKIQKKIEKIKKRFN